MKLTDIEEYSLRLIVVLGWNLYRQVIMANATILKAVMSTVKVFAV